MQQPGQKIGIICSNDVSFVLAQWGIWMSGNIAVPLQKANLSSDELEGRFKMAECAMIVTDEANLKIVRRSYNYN